MNDQSKQISEVAESIYKELPRHLSEIAYRNALAVDLRDIYKNVETEKYVPVIYKKQTIACLRTDICIDNKIVIEIKSIDKLRDKDIQQLETYLKIMNISEGYLINFGKNFEIKNLSTNKNNE